MGKIQLIRWTDRMAFLVNSKTIEKEREREREPRLIDRRIRTRDPKIWSLISDLMGISHYHLGNHRKAKMEKEYDRNSGKQLILDLE